MEAVPQEDLSSPNEAILSWIRIRPTLLCRIIRPLVFKKQDVVSHYSGVRIFYSSTQLDITHVLGPRQFLARVHLLSKIVFMLVTRKLFVFTSNDSRKKEFINSLIISLLVNIMIKPFYPYSYYRTFHALDLVWKWESTKLHSGFWVLGLIIQS